MLRRGVADLTLLGPPADIARRARELGLDIGDVTVVDPSTSDLRGEFAHQYANCAAPGVNLDMAWTWCET